MHRLVLVLALAVILTSSVWAQSVPRTAGDVWQARYVAALRQADDREARLIQSFDADRATYLGRIAEVSRARNLSAQALAEVTIRLGLQLAESGRPADIATILAAIDESATRIEELQARIQKLEAGTDPALAAQLARARVAINVGDLDGAEAILRAGRSAARAAREGAQLREAEVIGLEGNVANLRSDFLAAAALYEEAAQTAPDSEIEARWRYRMAQARAFLDRGERFGGPETEMAAKLYRNVALPLAPRAARTPSATGAETRWRTASAVARRVRTGARLRTETG